MFICYHLIYIILCISYCNSHVISDIGDKKECIITNSDSKLCEIDQYVGIKTISCFTIIYKDVII